LINIALVGYGYWGPNLARNIDACPLTTLHTVCDLNPSAEARVKNFHPNARFVTDFAAMLADDSIDAVVLATPVSSHAPLAIAAFQAGKHVLVEKPLSESSEAAAKVVDASKAAGKVLLVDHTFCYQGATRKVKELIDSGRLGKLFYFDSERVNLGLFQSDVSVLWDLAVHDLSILSLWHDELPTTISCTGAAHLEGHPVNMCHMNMKYPSGFTADISVNWLSPVKLRRILLGGSNNMVLFDDLDPVEKIKIYDRGVTMPESESSGNAGPLAYRRTGDVWMPQFSLAEALQEEIKHFAACIEGREAPTTSGEMALTLVRQLEAADESMRQGGAPVQL
jgi:predicted dehydrogenase